MKREKLIGSLGITSSLRIKLRGKNVKELLESKIEGRVEKRFSRKTGKALQIVWKDSMIVHLHCRDKSCGNEWKIKDCSDWKNKFDIKGSTIKCLRCGREYESG